MAEADDIANTLVDGVHGLVLAAETAVGVDPVGTVDMVRRVIDAFERCNLGPLLEDDPLVPAASSRRVLAVSGAGGRRVNGRSGPPTARPGP